MTKEQFFKELKKVSGWMIEPNTALIRTKVGSREFCPITAVALNKNVGKFATSQYREAANALGLALGHAHMIIKAADELSNGVTRKKLLKLCKLKEIPKTKG